MKKLVSLLAFTFTMFYVDAQDWRNVGYFNSQCLPGSAGGVLWNRGYIWGGGPTIIFNVERRQDCYWENQTVTETVTEYQRDQFGNYVLWNNQYIPIGTYQRTTTRRVKVCY